VSQLIVEKPRNAGQSLKLRLSLIYALLIAANLAAWAWAWVLFGDRPVLMGTALLAYVFGLRHAVDADHIAAIDTVVRKLMQDGQKPIAVGFFFSLGHSTVVALAALAVAATATALQGPLETFKSFGAVIGTTISAAFLFAMGIVNLVIFKAVWSAFQRVRRGGAIADDELDLMLVGGGFLARLCRPLFRALKRPWQMYPLGFLFGLGFDTATEVSLLGISAAQVAQGLSIWSILVFPALFTAGMALVDTTDSVLMTGAYGWAFVHPMRKLWYNLTITGASVAVAIFIGSVELAGLLVERFGLDGAFWKGLSGLNDNLGNFGFFVIGLFAAAWLASFAFYRWRGYES
jgi:nickel/cobalt transporter (NiCoT) family protein